MLSNYNHILYLDILGITFSMKTMLGASNSRPRICSVMNEQGEINTTLGIATLFGRFKVTWIRVTC